MNNKLFAINLAILLLLGSVVPGFTITPNVYASHNSNLYVSGESVSFNNRVSGAQVIEIVIRDNGISKTDQGVGEPDVTVNGKDVRMIQATDGAWYAYIADKKHALIADSTVGLVGKGLDFGTFCSSSSSALGFSVSNTVGISIPIHGTGVGGQNGTTGSEAITQDCSFANPKSTGAINVVREPKQANSNPAISLGQIGLQSSQLWPFIQLYDFTIGGDVIIKYNKGGGVQTTTLSYDKAGSMSKLDVDRTKYPRSAQIHATITDLNLNIDPTDEDSWSFGTLSSSPAVYYQLFDEKGKADADGTAGATNISSKLTSLLFENNGILKINPSAQGGSDVLTIQDNDFSQTNGNGFLSISNVATDGGSISAGNQPITITETQPNTGIFNFYDPSNDSVLVTTENAGRGTTATIEYNKKTQSLLIGFGTGSIKLDESFKGKEWNSGEELPVFLVDSDGNKNSRVAEDFDLSDPRRASIPSLTTGDPFTLGDSGTDTSTKIKASFLNGFTLTPTADSGKFTIDTTPTLATAATVEKVEKFSERALIIPTSSANTNAIVIDLRTTVGELRQSIFNPFDPASKFRGINMFNYDIRSLNSTIPNLKVHLLVNQSSTGTIINDNDGSVVSDLVAISLANMTTLQNIVNLSSETQIQKPSNLHNLLFGSTLNANNKIGLMFSFSEIKSIGTATRPIVADFFSFGIINDGVLKQERIANQIVRIEVEETANNSDSFRGSLEYIRLNQFNIFNAPTFEKLIPIDDEPNFIVLDRLLGNDSPRVSYSDLGQDGVITTISDQQEAITHTGVVSLNKKTFKPGDTIEVKLQDKDLNTNADAIDIYTVVDPSKFPNDPAVDAVGRANMGTFSDGTSFGRVLDITFDDERWVKSTITFNGKKCSSSISGLDGLFSTGFTLVETDKSSGLFTGEFKLPSQYCSRSQGKVVSTSGVDVEARYFDFRDASGQIIKTGSSSGVGANSGSISLDRTVYPVPFGSVKDFFSTGSTPATTPSDKSIFPVHNTGITKNGNLKGIDANSEELANGDLEIHVRINDLDFDVSPNGEDKIAQNVEGKQHGPVKVMVSRGASSLVLATAGSDVAKDGVITIGKDAKNGITRELGPITEVAPSAGIFELDLSIRYTDGPASPKCPATLNYSPLDKTKTGIQSRFETTPTSGNYCIMQGDILTVEYTDPADSSGSIRTVTDSALFDLRNGVLQSDKSVYIIGSDMILTLIEPDLNLDSDNAETITLDLIEWDSDDARITMGKLGGAASKNGQLFDPEPSALRETSDNSGIFQAVIEIPSMLNNKPLDRGERIDLEYTDWGPSGADYVGDDDENIQLTFFTSNFGATIELDQRVYTWTDKVYITIVAPDHNFDSNKIDEIGNTPQDEIKINTRGKQLKQYKLAETGTDTGIFAGEVILTGFKHDADGDPRTGDSEGIDTTPRTTPLTGGGPTNGFLEAKNDDGLTVSFLFSDRETTTGSALIKWNIGEVEWFKDVNLKNGQGTVRVIDPDMNLNPEAVDTFTIDVWSDSDIGGIDVTVTETNEATGIFEGIVFFTTTATSSGNKIRVSEGDVVTAKYEDNTLPSPYTKADELKITSTTFIGTLVPPLERAPLASPRITNSIGTSLEEISVGQQILITSNIASGQTIQQKFVYLVQIQDLNGITHSLAWITGNLNPGQSLSPSLSWLPKQDGYYEITIFAWESIENPEPLSPTAKIFINVI